jgi:hypothetical protein
MEIDETATSEVTEEALSVEADADAKGFGTRPRTDRPHSINLFGTDQSGSRSNGSRALDLLIGIGIGAAAMFVLARRRGG